MVIFNSYVKLPEGKDFSVAPRGVMGGCPWRDLGIPGMAICVIFLFDVRTMNIKDFKGTPLTEHIIAKK